MRRRWIWPLIVLALAAVVWWAERGSGPAAKSGAVEPVRPRSEGPAGEMRPAPTPTPPAK